MCTAFFFLRTDPFPPVRTDAISLASFSWSTGMACKAGDGGVSPKVPPPPGSHPREKPPLPEHALPPVRAAASIRREECQGLARGIQTPARRSHTHQPPHLALSAASSPATGASLEFSAAHAGSPLRQTGSVQSSACPIPCRTFPTHPPKHPCTHSRIGPPVFQRERRPSPSLPQVGMRLPSFPTLPSHTTPYAFRARNTGQQGGAHRI